MFNCFKDRHIFSIVNCLLVFIFIAGCTHKPAEIPITTKSEEARALFIKGRDMYDHLRTDEAREYFTKAIELDPEFAQAYVYRSKDVESDEDIVTNLKQAVALMDKVSEGEQLLIKQEKASWLDNDSEKRLELRRELVQKYPGDKRAHSLLGMELYSRDKDIEAIAQYEKAVSLDKKYAPAYNMLGYCYREVRDYKKAEEAFKTYIKLIPEEPDPYDSMGDLFTKMGRFENAIDFFRKAVDRDSVYAVSMRKTGTCLVWLGRYDEGREAYMRAIDMELSAWDKLEDRDLIVRSHLYEGDYQKALKETEVVLEAGIKAQLPSWTPWEYLQQSTINIEEGDLDVADKCIAEYYKSMEGTHFSAYFNFEFAYLVAFREALIASKRKDFEVAIEKAEKFKSIWDERKAARADKRYNGLLGLVYFYSDDYPKAIEHFMASDQEYPYTLYYHGKAQLMAGHKDKAQELFKKAANWNEDSYEYALIRGKALAELKN